MPTLPQETNLFPCDLLSSPAVDHWQPSDSDRWWALHTRPRAEKALARRLFQQNIAFYLPLYARRQRYQRRLVESFLPLFPGYLFIRGDDDTRRAAFSTHLLAGCLNVADQKQLASDLTRIQSLIGGEAPVTPEERLQPGMPAEIVRGPLAGQRGTVMRRGNSMRFVMAVDFLQRGASIEVDVSEIAAL